MPDEMEQIEARLAAYVDDMLPPQQRAEIEAYLAANPTHERLIAELVSIKAAVGSLPSEKAPAEVLDTLQAHLERQTLLDGVEHDGERVRGNYWPHFGAVAAVLMLAAGLGLLVYQVLPRPKPAVAIVSTTSAGDDGVTLDDGTKTDTKAARGTQNGRTNPMAQAGTGLTSRPDGFGGFAARPDADSAGPTIAMNSSNAGDDISNLNSRRNNPLPRDARGPSGGGMSQFGTAQNVDPLATGEALKLGSPANGPIAANAGGATPDGMTAGGSTPTGITPANVTPVCVVTVSTDDLPVTQNLLASYFAQQGLAAERPGEAKDIDQPVSKAENAGGGGGIGGGGGGGVDVGGRATSRPFDGTDKITLAGLFADQAARPVLYARDAGPSIVVRHLTAAQVGDAVRFIRSQRPARQRADAVLQVGPTTQPFVEVPATPTASAARASMASATGYPAATAPPPTATRTTGGPVAAQESAAGRPAPGKTQPAGGTSGGASSGGASAKGEAGSPATRPAVVRSTPATMPAAVGDTVADAAATQPFRLEAGASSPVSPTAVAMDLVVVIVRSESTPTTRPTAPAPATQGGEEVP